MFVLWHLQLAVERGRTLTTRKPSRQWTKDASCQKLGIANRHQLDQWNNCAVNVDILKKEEEKSLEKYTVGMVNVVGSQYPAGFELRSWASRFASSAAIGYRSCCSAWIASSQPPTLYFLPSLSKCAEDGTGSKVCPSAPGGM